MIWLYTEGLDTWACALVLEFTSMEVDYFWIPWWALYNLRWWGGEQSLLLWSAQSMKVVCNGIEIQEDDGEPCRWYGGGDWYHWGAIWFCDWEGPEVVVA